MYFKVPYLVFSLSKFMTFELGDIISTGTPRGVGFGKRPQVYLEDEQLMEVGIEKLGIQKQITVAL